MDLGVYPEAETGSTLLGLPPTPLGPSYLYHITTLGWAIAGTGW